MSVLSGIIGPFQILIIIFIAFFIVAVPVIALVDILRSEFRGSNDKLIWVIIVVFTWLIGAILYFVIGKKQKLNPPV